MILIIGGYAQGKKEYAQEHYKDANAHMVILNDIVRKAYKEERDPIPEIEAIIAKDKDTVFISDEIGCGVVPAEPFERGFRDHMGRTQVKIADMADEVIRVICGLGQKIK